MKKYIKILFASVLFAALIIGASSCTKDLEQIPITDETSANLYPDFNNYHGLLAKVYTSLAVSGQTAGDGNPDISGLDGGMQNYTRMYFIMQDITTDEVVNGWNDGTLPTLVQMTWTPSSEFVNAMYNRLYVIMSFANEFIRNTTDDKLGGYGLSGDNLAEAKYMRAEARFIRAFVCYDLLDLFGNAPYMTEADMPGMTVPKQTSRAELYNFVETELLAVADELKAPGTNEYGRVDQAAAWALLAKLYLNSQVYVNQDRNSDVITYCNKIISSGKYSLKPVYAQLFMADNDKNNPEVIFPICFDGTYIQTYGGSTYMVCAAVGGSMTPADLGISGGWAGNRVTQQFVDLFDPTDIRGNFYTDGQNKEVATLGSFSDGYAFVKYSNKTSAGANGSNATYCDADIPVFRLADVYLMYAEAVLRGGGGDMNTALGYVNALRSRAGTSALTSSSSMTLNFILDERARELSWESTRRTDLIRFGKFTTNDYLWAWKGGVAAGQAVDNSKNLFPIPASVLTGNPNLQQNPGY